MWNDRSAPALDRRRLAFLAAGLAWTLLAALPAAAQGAGDAASDAADEAPAQDFFDVVEVEIVNIDVWVTDKAGEPVEGLGKDDFEVFRDGRPVEVTNFYAVVGGRPAGAPAGNGAPGTAASETGRAPSLDLARPASEVEVPPEHRLWLIVYFDNYNVEALERNRVLPALRHFLGQTLRAGDQAMLVTYSRALEVRQPFTADLPVLMAALDEVVDDAGLAAVRRRDQVATLHRIDGADSADQALAYARQYAEEQMSVVEHTTGALERLIDSLAGLPGRKALVHVSSGIPMLAGEEMFHAVAEKFGTSRAYGEIPRHDTSRSFERVNRRANAHRVTFYTLDAGGLRGMEFGNAEYAGFVDMDLRSTLDSVVPENLQSSLRFMALETGGQAIVNQNEILPALEKAARDFRSFYSLGIASQGADTGRYHEIEVKLRDGAKGLRVRHREGYQSKTADTAVRESLRSALLYAHQANPLGVTVRWGRAEPYGDDGNYLLPIQLHIPMARVALLPTRPGRHEARLKLFVGAAGPDGEVSDVDTSPLGLQLADEHVEAAKKESLVHTHKLLLNPGRKKVAVAILDLFGRESSVVTRTLQVGPAPDSG